MSLLNSVEKSWTRQRVTSPNVLQYASETRNKGTFNDITIEAGIETIAANRMILSCCSRFFEGMFDLEMKEKYQHDPVQINGFDGKAVKALIDFMYSGEVTIKNENVMDLLAASDYLQVDEVKQFCFEFLESILSSDNWFAIRSAADLYQNKHLQNQAGDFISKNLDAVIETDEFKSLDKDDVRSCIEKLNRNHATEISIFNGLVSWCQIDMESRKNDFFKLFEDFVKLDSISVHDLEETVLKESLVTENIQCWKLVTKSVCQRSKDFDTMKIVSFGGRKAEGKCTEIYNCTNKPPKLYPDLPKHLFGHCTLLMNDCIFCFGGASFNDKNQTLFYNKVWKMNMNEQVLKWKEIAPLNQCRTFFSCAVFRETLVVAGGNHEGSAVEFYQGAINEWKTSSSLRQARNSSALVASDQYLYALGGWSNNKCLSSVERAENLNDEWQLVSPMQMPRKWLAAVYCDGAVYAIGGRSDKNTITNTVEKYDSDEDEWTYVSSMMSERSAHAACVMNGKIFVVGGVDTSIRPVNTIECYNPLTDSWSIVGKIDVELFHHAIVAL